MTRKHQMMLSDQYLRTNDRRIRNYETRRVFGCDQEAAEFN